MIVMPRKKLFNDCRCPYNKIQICLLHEPVNQCEAQAVNGENRKCNVPFPFNSKGNISAILLSLRSGSLLWNVEQNNVAWPRNCTVSVVTEVKPCCKHEAIEQNHCYICNLAHAFIFRITENSRNVNTLILKIRSTTTKKSSDYFSAQKLYLIHRNCSESVKIE